MSIWNWIRVVLFMIQLSNQSLSLLIRIWHCTLVLEHSPIAGLHVEAGELKSLHWLKIQQHIECEVISITYKTLQSGQPSYLHSLLNVQSNHTTRSSYIITLQRPSVSSHFKVIYRSFTHHAPVLWNSVPKQLRQPSRPQSLDTTTDSTTILALFSHQFHSKLRAFLFEQSFPP